MKNLALSLAVLLLPLSAAAAANESASASAGAPRELGVEASIVFPSNSSIRDWQADQGRGIWIQDRRKNWYYGSFAGFCRDADFAQAIGVETRGAGRLDRFSYILVRGERCPLTSFVSSAGPPAKQKKAADPAAEN